MGVLNFDGTVKATNLTDGSTTKTMTEVLAGGVTSIGGQAGAITLNGGLTIKETNVLYGGQRDVLPDAGDTDYQNKIIQYTGITTDLLQNGYFYKSVNIDGTYTWTQWNVQQNSTPTTSLSLHKLAITYSASGTEYNSTVWILLPVNTELTMSNLYDTVVEAYGLPNVTGGRILCFAGSFPQMSVDKLPIVGTITYRVYNNFGDAMSNGLQITAINSDTIYSW